MNVREPEMEPNKSKEYRRVSEASEIIKKEYVSKPLEPELLEMFTNLLKAVPKEFINVGKGCRCGKNTCPLNLASVIADRFVIDEEYEAKEELEDKKD
jgi:hypothetical protein